MQRTSGSSRPHLPLKQKGMGMGVCYMRHGGCVHVVAVSYGQDSGDGLV